MKFIVFVLIGLMVACSNPNKPHNQKDETLENQVAVLDTIWQTEQEPIRRRDSLMKIYGADSQLFQEQQAIYKRNHRLNEQKVRQLLDTYGWPDRELIGPHGNLTLCNVIQHSDNAIRLHYLPLMRQAVKDKKLEPWLLGRTEDRIATERGDLQIYGGQMKYYPETKSFNVWPVYDPANVDKRRAEIGLEPIAKYLKERFNFEWNLEEQIKRTEAFKREQAHKKLPNNENKERTQESL